MAFLELAQGDGSRREWQVEAGGWFAVGGEKPGGMGSSVSWRGSWWKGWNGGSRIREGAVWGNRLFWFCLRRISVLFKWLWRAVSVELVAFRVSV